MADLIKNYIINFFRPQKLNGVLFFSGSFSRNEISIIEGVLVSDIELVYVCGDSYQHKKLKKHIINLQKKLYSEFKEIPKNLEIEIETISLDLIKNSSLKVHQYEAILNSDIVFNKEQDFNWLFSHTRLNVSSVYDIFLHRILNQISLAYNFKKVELNGIFYNRSKKNASDFLTYYYLLERKDIDSWVIKKSERLNLLRAETNLLPLRSDYLIETNPNKKNTSFNDWKNIFSFWIKHYKKNNNEMNQTLVNKRSFISKAYSIIIYFSLKLRFKSIPTPEKIIGFFENALKESKSFSEFNLKLTSSLSVFGYSKISYPYINAVFFSYWIRHRKYYKSLK